MKNPTYRLALIVTVASLLCTSVPAFASETDDRIESSIRNSYVFKTFANGDDVKIKSTDGVVTLTGTVSEERHKLLAGETVASLSDVKSFDNKLAVKSEIPVMNSNAWLINRVKSTLWFHRNVNATETEVLAKDGTVTLRGEATSAAQKDLTTEYAKDVEGVKTVKNEMLVTTVTKEPGEKTIGQKMDDVSITALVKTTLFNHRSTNAINTIVETKEGVVTLKGKAKNGAEKDLAAKLVSDVLGVKKVINEMTVE